MASKTGRTKIEADKRGWVWVIVIPTVTLLVALGIFVMFRAGPALLGQVAPANPSPTPGEAVYILKGHTGSVDSVAFSPDGKTLASMGGMSDGRMKLWRVADGSLLYSIDANVGANPGGPHGIGFSPNGKIIATATTNGTVGLWNAADGSAIRELTGPGPHRLLELHSVAFSPDGQTIAAGGLGIVGNSSDSATVHVWRAADGKPMLELHGNPSISRSVAFSPDGQYLAAVGDNFEESPGVYIWHMPDGKLIRALDHMDSSDLAFSPDGKTLAVASKAIYLLRVPDGAVASTLNYSSGPFGESLAFSPDGKTLVTGAWDNTVRLWRVTDGKELHTWRGHETYVNSVAFSPDGKMVASGSLDMTVRLWAVPSSPNK